MKEKPTINENLVIYCFCEQNWNKKFDQKKNFFLATVKKSTYSEKTKYSKQTIDKLLAAFNQDYNSFFSKKKIIKKNKKNKKIQKGNI